MDKIVCKGCEDEDADDENDEAVNKGVWRLRHTYQGSGTKIYKKENPDNVLTTDPHTGQKWENFLKPGRQQTRQLAHQEPQKKQQMANIQPSVFIFSSTLVNTWGCVRG